MFKTLGQIALSLIPAIGQSKANKLARRRDENNPFLKEAKTLNESLKKEQEMSIFDTPEGQALLTELENMENESMRSIDAQGAVGGLTEEAKIASMGKVKGARAKALSGLSRQGTFRRNNIRTNRLRTIGQMFGMDQQLRATRNQQSAGLGQSLSDSIGNFIQMGEIGKQPAA